MSYAFCPLCKRLQPIKGDGTFVVHTLPIVITICPASRQLPDTVKETN